MALSTSYFTVDGQITGESIGGTRLDYLTDALGSVTAKVNQLGTVVSLARYKPHGEKLAGLDYTFGWIGSFGYRRTVEGHYIRRRHYVGSLASWTAVDKLWLSQLPYSYCKSNPKIGRAHV